MLGLVFVYFLGRSFYKLAELYDRNKWGYGILGVFIYYAGTILGGIIIAICYLISMGLENVDNIETALDGWKGLLVIPFGLASCWLAYKFMENRFEKSLEGKPIDMNSDILDEDF